MNGTRLYDARFAFQNPVPLVSAPMGLGNVYSLGQTPEEQEWYARAKSAVAHWEMLNARVYLIADLGARQSIISWIGSLNIPDSPAERYQTVVNNILVAEKTVPATITNYGGRQWQNRVGHLEDFNDDLDARIVNAEKTYGTRPPPTPGLPPVSGAKTDYTLPLVIGGAAIGVVVLVSLLS